MQWAGHMACMADRCIQGFGRKCLKERNNLEERNAKGSIA
jgi:hypothetical protein